MMERVVLIGGGGLCASGVGTGSVVVRDISPGVTACGNPCREVTA